MTSEDFAKVKKLVETFDTPEMRERYKRGDFPRADKVKDLNMRYRWDLAHMARIMSEPDSGLRLYSYLNDDHIDTALRNIVQPLEKRYES